MGSFTEDCELPIYYDPVEKYACEQRGETYWGDTDEMTQVSFDDPDSSDFRMYWTYMPKIRILDQNDYTYTAYAQGYKCMENAILTLINGENPESEKQVNCPLPDDRVKQPIPV